MGNQTPRPVRHLPRLAPAVIIGLAVLISGIRGIYTIGPGEAAALQTFGDSRPKPVTSEGLLVSMRCCRKQTRVAAVGDCGAPYSCPPSDQRKPTPQGGHFMAGITIHIDERHITETLRRPIPRDHMEVIRRQLEQFVRDQDFQQAVDREILRLCQAESQPPVFDQAVIWTDGSCLGNPGKGGWGVVVTDTAGQVLDRRSGFKPKTTNNQMELAAIAEGLELIAGQCREITIRSDSRYACDAFNKGWLKNWHRNGWLTYSKQPVKNQDLWQRIERAIAKHDGPVEFKWVKGHAGHPGNELADNLANQAARRG